MLQQPSWVNFAGVDRARLTHLWDDARVVADFAIPRIDIASQAIPMSARARMVLAAGLAEWVVWRFDGLHSHGDEPVQIVEAAWAATVEPKYLAFFDLTREHWVGPVDGPLWLALTCLQHGLPKGYAFEGDLYKSLEILYALAAHVLPDRRPYDAWLDIMVRRLSQDFASRPVDPFDDLFEHRVGERLGPLIGRDSLDPGQPVDTVRDRIMLSQLLHDARASGNPFLATPDELQELGFAGTPYVIP